MKKLNIVIALFFTCRFSFSQNVGIGTATPTKGKLEVVGVAGAGNTTAIFGSSATGVSLQQNWPTIGFNQYRDNTVGNGRFMGNGYAALQYLDPNGGGMYIDMLGSGLANNITSSGVRALTILANGNVGILNNGGDASLTVTRNSGIDGTVRFQGTTIASYFHYGSNEDTYIRAGKFGGKVFINDISDGVITMGGNNSNGKVGINTISPNYPLEITQFRVAGVDQGILLRSVFGDEWELRNNTTFFWILNGLIKSQISPSTGSWNAVSDKRLKKNFKELPLIMDKIMQLHPLQYEMINDPIHSGTKTGFIAQDVKALFPDLVTVFNDTVNATGYKDIHDLHMMDYSGFGVLAIKAIQEQQQEIKDLQKQIDELKAIIRKQ